MDAIPSKEIRMDTWNCLERMGDAETGEIRALAATALGAMRIATAVSDAAGNLKIIASDRSGFSSCKRKIEDY